MLLDIFFFKQKTAYEMRISDWSSDVCSSDLVILPLASRGIFAGVLLAFARALGEFGATLMIAGSIPGRTQTLSTAIYEAVQAGNDSLANTLVLITAATCIVVLLAANRLWPDHARRSQGRARL